MNKIGDIKDDDVRVIQNKCKNAKRATAERVHTRSNVFMSDPLSSGLRLVVAAEHEGDVTAGELLVHAAEAVELVLERGGVLRVEEALDQLAAVSGDTGALASDLRGVDKVLEDVLVDSGKGAVTGAHLLAGLGAAGLGEDSSLADEDDVAVRELLLELTGEPG